jgi:RNA polymerase sigma-70 factor (ECF subfamily)
MPAVVPFQASMSQTNAAAAAGRHTLGADDFEHIYRQYAGRIYALATRMSGSPSEGEDLLQEIFIHAYKKLDGFRGESSVGTWLHRLAVNYCLDYLRSTRRKMANLTTAIDAAPGLEPAIRDERAAHRIDLERAIRRLPDGCRELFVLHDVEGFNHQEIAAMLEISVGTSKSQVFKARHRLRALLNDHASR